ncbi:DUF2798 domain-containing protein [Pseudoalteromonas carrageenovora]|uniref:DUF2798 domain-containing protein n=1 Tax=Pseudoalteromonas carrageenovora TaxID=227 RepID=UPI00211741FA|nr:DUF2798 domain-containing protein [Pseudoalteromonas carrageenovora]MCQ8889701.1 DUF2798 domain-containing protein [Pseudoalteromonas carrageenovora]MDO6547130.1 DUF2798 domain-containing protein [Pseudoalteromonas carrageenovora]MDO6831578.1 DUF2798 domain-containing protein [Pseudoalteromonas carrageenovora]MDO6834503.1 DUF2798 domain-containing protein [Pseudoalteromonas carrageenovora]
MSTSVSVNPEMVEPNKTPVIYKILVMVSIIALIGGTLTGIMTYVNVGVTEQFYADWFTSFISAVLVMAPIGFVMMTLMHKLVNKLLPSSSKLKRNLVISVFMALTMESLMAFVTATNNIGYADMRLFLNGWAEGLLAALPIGLTIMLIMSVTVKPKLERFLKS